MHDVVVFVCGYVCEYVYVCATTYVWRSEGKLSGQSLSFTLFKTGLRDALSVTIDPQASGKTGLLSVFVAVGW